MTTSVVSLCRATLNSESVGITAAIQPVAPLCAEKSPVSRICARYEPSAVFGSPSPSAHESLRSVSSSVELAKYGSSHSGVYG